MKTEYNAPGSPVWDRTGFMHLQRYRFAGSYIRGKSVLNVGCGPGYAERVLAEYAPRSITAIDYDAALIASLREKQSDPGTSVPISYVHADAERLPAGLGPFDVVISFENIEHLQDPARFLAGLHQLRSEAGTVLILSTPNALHYSRNPTVQYRNPFHVREFDGQELLDLVAPYVGNVQLLGQVERDYNEAVLEVEHAFRALNSLLIVRLERSFRRLVGRPVRPFHFLPFHTDILPLSPSEMHRANEFVLVGDVL